MVDRKTATVVLTVLGSSVLVQLVAGIFAGLRQEWLRVSILLTGSVLAFITFTSSLMVMKIDTCFSRLENLMLKKLNSLPQ